MGCEYTYLAFAFPRTLRLSLPRTIYNCVHWRPGPSSCVQCSLTLSHIQAKLNRGEPTMASISKVPTFDELPGFKDFSGCAWEVWGKDDQLGTVNLLTEEVVKEASKEIECVLEFLVWVPFSPLTSSLAEPARRSA